MYSYEGEEGRQDPGFRENVFEILEGSALVPFIEVSDTFKFGPS